MDDSAVSLPTDLTKLNIGSHPAAKQQMRTVAERPSADISARRAPLVTCKHLGRRARRLVDAEVRHSGAPVSSPCRLVWAAGAQSLPCNTVLFLCTTSIPRGGSITLPPWSRQNRPRSCPLLAGFQVAVRGIRKRPRSTSGATPSGTGALAVGGVGAHCGTPPLELFYPFLYSSKHAPKLPCLTTAVSCYNYGAASLCLSAKAAGGSAAEA